MITQRDITKLKKVFVTRAEMNARFDKLDKDNEEQTLSLAQTFNDINTRFDLVEKRLDKIEATQQKILEKLDSMEKFMKLMSIKLLDHEKRLVTLESKILLS